MTTLPERMGIEPGHKVMEIGWNEKDGDLYVREAIEERLSGDLLDEDSDEVIDVALLWFRAGDGDLVDLLVDARGPLADNGAIWVLTPASGQTGYVEPTEIKESAGTAGLTIGTSIDAGENWTATRLLLAKG